MLNRFALFTLLPLLAMHSTPSADAPENWDFTSPSDQTWSPLNDNVMGGISSGRIAWMPEGLHWTGATRLENNGGFSSVRSPWGNHDFYPLEAIIIRCRGNGGQFKFTLECSERWYVPYAYAPFTPTPDWTDIRLPLADFKWSQAFTGDTRIDASLRDVLRMGLLKYDGQAQPFELDVASIRFE